MEHPNNSLSLMSLKGVKGGILEPWWDIYISTGIVVGTFERLAEPLDQKVGALLLFNGADDGRWLSSLFSLPFRL